MRVAMLAPIAWSTPPAAYGPWEQVTSHLTEGLVQRGIDVTLFATGSSRTAGKLVATVPAGYAEREGQDPKVLEYLHIGQVMQAAADFDIVHNQFDFMPLGYSPLISPPMVTTVHGFSSEHIVPVYQKYNDTTDYVSISNANRDERLDYIATVYNGVDTRQFTFRDRPGHYLLYFGRIHPEKGTAEAIAIARRARMPLWIAGLIQDHRYFDERVAPHIDDESVRYLGNVGPADRDRILGGAHALLHPISFDEPFGLSVAESMVTGTPVIAFDRGSMPELIDHGRTGYLTDSVEEAADLVGCITDLDRFFVAEVARDRFSVEVMVDNYIDVYQTILARA
ncbi:glycosyltransferase involved in cell wall biosynthesis [Lewinella marina]|uniref:Glycosyl transferase n=1 Tax=Neolewinella marina TaxID=438751 RepID=A0A2G0CIL3_9BACT|nr:glycosyltransferase family 4 protein [Neolewinella marina]NJB85045.1 glycosyltransferase involved in cell wall biosynthesis [Neolewinella marina]PHK99809.1 glycosyl transferase [Neolewinella marina]